VKELALITLIAEHWSDPNGIGKGTEAIKNNTQNLKNIKGLISRIVLKSEIDPYKITTVTTFADKSSYENFVNGVEQRNAKRAKDGVPSLFRGEKLEGYEVLVNI